MTNVKLSINIDAELKESAQKVLEGMQLNLTTYVNMALDQLVKKNKVPFEIEGKQLRREEALQILEAELAKGVKDFENGNFFTADEIRRDLGL